MEAVSAAKSADGVVRTEFKSTTDSMTATIQQNKSDADGKISTAQTTATQALDGLATKVSQTEYNTKTGQLQTDLTETTQTANQAKTDIVSIKQKDGEQDERMNSIVSDANGTKQTVSDLQTVQGKQSGDISTLQQRADGFEATVTKVNNLSVGGRNLFLNSRTLSDMRYGINGNATVTVEPFDITTNMWHVVSAKGTGVNVGIYILDYGNGKIPNNSYWSYSADIKGTGKVVRFGIEASVFSTIKGIVGDNWSRVSRTGHVNEPQRKTIIMYFDTTDSPLDVYIKLPKLELGNVPTDWTPAPEDLSSATAKAQLTADDATLSINNYKTDADQRISKAQADIKVNADAITQKVSKSDYNAKTGELTTSVSKAQQTADTATQTIGTYKEYNDKRVAAAETNIKANSDAIEFTASKTELNSATGDLKSDISTLQQRADGFEATVTKVNNLAIGGRNLIVRTGEIDGKVISPDGGIMPWGGSALTPAIISVKPGNPLTMSGTKGGDNTFRYAFYDKDGNTIVRSYVDHLSPATTVIAPAESETFRISYPKEAQVKLERGNIATDWTPAPEDVDAKIAQVKITADGVYQTVNNPQTGLNTRVSTAEGNINTIKSNVDGMSNTVTETADGLTREIADRKTGDSNTLQAGKDFTTSQITSYDTGMQSRLTQVSDGIMAQVSSTNLITDSSFVNATDNWTLAGDVSWKIDNEIMRKGVRVATFDNGATVFDGKIATLTSVPIYTINLGGTQFYASFDLYAKSFGTSSYFKAEIVQKNISGITTKRTAIGGSFDTAMSDWTNYTADITLDPATTQLYLQFTQYGGGVIYVSRPYLGSVKLQKNAYIAGASTDNSSTLKLFNNFFAFGIQSNTGEIISGINGDSSGLIITGKKITVSGDTTFIGNNFMDGAIIKNASIGSAQIAKASITDANIVSLNVDKLSGNVSNFIQSNWNGKYGSTTIDASGMKVETNGVNTKFNSSGMELTKSGESVGGIGVQGLVGKPSNYQGLAFWLDGKAEYMSWGARQNGATTGNPINKFSWFRSTSVPTGAYAGFNFDDDVIFNYAINVPGASKGQFVFGTQNFNNANYPFFGDRGLRSGLAYGTNRTYLISDGAVYNLSVVIMALSGLGAVKIPSAINSDGTVKTWFNVTL